MLAYTAPVEESYDFKHSAVFVMKADGTGARQVSFPFPLEPYTCEGQCDNGHESFDTQAAWTPDGKLAFIRMVHAGDESPGGRRARHLRPRRRPGGGASMRYLIRKLAYTTVVGGYRVHGIDWAGRRLESFPTGLDRSAICFTPDGNSILRNGCAADRGGQMHCGLVTHRLADPDGDIRPEDPVEAPSLDMTKVIKTQAMPGYRSNFEIQRLVDVPGRIVEPLIALSIAYVAIQTVLGGGSRYRLPVVFAFGLLHGLGFAGTVRLSDDALGRLLTSLVSFNAGIELGQALIIGALFPALLVIRRFGWSGTAHAAAGSAAAAVGLFWFAERLPF